MNIYKVSAGLKSWHVHACTVGTAINRTSLGKLKRDIVIHVELIEKNADNKRWNEFKQNINA
jgi:hypothetical protein